MKIKIVHNAREATGTTVIIDVFRAFTVEPYMIYNGADKVIPVGDMQIAYDYKNTHNDCILIGERNGKILPGFDYGNSPSEIKNIDFTGKTIIHTTSCGTQGIANSINATEILTGSFVNSNAIAKYILSQNPEEVSIASLCRPGENPASEDELCALYIKSLLEGYEISDLSKKIEALKFSSGAKFFDKTQQDVFPEMDFYLCTELNKFDFVLKVEKDISGLNYIKKIT